MKLDIKDIKQRAGLIESNLDDAYNKQQATIKKMIKKITKPEVLDLAKKAGLVSSDAKDFNHLQGDLMKFTELVRAHGTSS